ncbi:MAG: DUF3999 family protein [Flavobacteriaceae bacterium]|nr:DUF3999 family protein [Flavobacteriaceae bacterium]
MAEYNYKRELKGITNQWHKIILPNELFGKTSQNLTDLRVLGLTESNDTIEAPYLLRLATEKISSKDVVFKTYNASHNDKGYYFTFEIPTIESINQIKLDFNQQNFDWLIAMEGSQNQNEWFTVVENYRILSIKNSQTDFQFTKLTFPSSKYRFYRVFINSKEKPELSHASITQNDITDGSFRKYNVKIFKVKENKQSKQTEIDVELELPVRISRINIGIADSFDYYRPVTIKYLADSFKTERGWKYNYRTLTLGTLNSIEKNEFQFNSTTVQKLKIYIDNKDNQSLKIDKIEVKGYEHELVARFTDQVKYFLTYGNKSATKPNYDIGRFAENIPETLTALELGNELLIEKEEVVMTAPLFKNKAWLWAIMTVIILLLGWFSLMMVRKK